MDEFNAQAAAFVEKAKKAGKSNTAIANTLKFMYQMTLANIEADQQQQQIDNSMMMTPYQEETLALERDRLDASKNQQDNQFIPSYDSSGNVVGQKLVDKKSGAVVQDYSAPQLSTGVLGSIESEGKSGSINTSVSPKSKVDLEAIYTTGGQKTASIGDMALKGLKEIDNKRKGLTDVNIKDLNVQNIMTPEMKNTLTGQPADSSTSSVLQIAGTNNPFLKLFGAGK